MTLFWQNPADMKVSGNSASSSSGQATRPGGGGGKLHLSPEMEETIKRMQVTHKGPCSKAREEDSRTLVQICILFEEEPSQFSVGETAQSLTCSIMENPTLVL